MQELSRRHLSAKTVLAEYWSYLKHYPGSLVLTIISVLGIQAASLISPLFFRQFFNVLSSQNPSVETLHQLELIIVLFGLASFFSWAMQRLQAVATHYLESHLMQDLYKSSFAYLLGHSYNFFTSNFAGSLTHKVSRFARSFEQLFDTVIYQFAPTFLFVAGAVVILFFRNHLLGEMLGAWALVFIAFQIWISNYRQPYRAARAEADTKTTGTIADAISNQNTIALFSGKAYEESVFSEVLKKWHTATLTVWTVDERIWGAMGLLFVGINVAMLYGAAIFWQRGAITIGDFVLIQSYLLTTFGQLIGINRALRGFYDSFADASEMITILKTPHEVQDLAGAPRLKVSNGEVSFKDVDFYFTDRPVLEKFNLVIAPREKIALVGPSGAGKSTITKLLLRLYDVKSGSIEIDGQNIAEVTQESLRNSIAFVPQEPILFHRTLKENIRYGRRDASDEEVITAAKAAHCHEFISAQPEGYDTFVGERGIKLSGGERQRVAIVRAILKDAPVLILDEATSSLDSESESLIQDALEALMHDKTVLVIAHRLSTIMKMDRIVSR
ncbi:MAG: ABC transporter ATP-binding protein [Patescibacteria group bacterium]|nr:ABC transporter ATP-binding protein [Patescibacteria group bacterium]